MLREFEPHIIDTHVHIGNDLHRDGGLDRQYNLRDLPQSPFSVVGKSHFLSFVPEGINNFGSMTLNEGFNAENVYVTAKEMSNPWVVWGPTLNASAHIEATASDQAWKKLFEGAWCNESVSVLDEKGNLRVQAIETLEAIKESNAIFATGHLSSREVMKIVDKAIDIGVRSIVLTHVSSRHNRLSIDEQKELIQIGEQKGVSVYAEHCAITWIDGKPDAYNFKDDFVKPIQQVGPEHCILSSDCGRIVPFDSNKPVTPFDCLSLFINLLQDYGITRNGIYQMVVSNPQKLLGILV